MAAADDAVEIVEWKNEDSNDEGEDKGGKSNFIEASEASLLENFWSLISDARSPHNGYPSSKEHIP